MGANEFTGPERHPPTGHKRAPPDRRRGNGGGTNADTPSTAVQIALQDTSPEELGYVFWILDLLIEASPSEARRKQAERVRAAVRKEMTRTIHRLK